MNVSFRARHLLGIAVVVMLAAMASTVTAAPTTQDQSGWYEDALIRFHDGDYQGALIQLKNVLQENPTNLSARILLGRTYLLLGAPADAEKELETAARMGADDELIIGHLAQSYLQQHRYKDVLAKILPGNRSAAIEAAVLGARATAYYELFRYEDAKQDFQSARKLAPDDPLPILGVARVLMRQGKFSEAETLVTEASQLNPKHHDLWYVRGELFVARQEFNAAVQAYSRAVELVPAHFPARIARASAMMQLGRHKEALQDLNFVRSYDRLDPQSAYLMSLALAADGQHRAAKDALNEADLIIRNTNPAFLRNHAPTMLTAATINYAQGKVDEARTYLEDYVEMVPSHSGAKRLLAQILVGKREPKRAAELLSQLLKENPDNWRDLSLMGAALMQLNRSEEAQKYFERAAELNPDGEAVRTRLAMSKLLTGESDLAVQELKASLQENPGSKRQAALLGFLHLNRGEVDQAIAIAKELIAQKPDNPLALNLLGGALMAKGDRAGARSNFEKALSISPSYRPAMGNLARLELQDGNTAKARQLYLDALRRNVNDAAAMKALGQIAELDKDLESAVQWYEKAVAADRKDVATQIALIRAYQQLGKSDRVAFLLHELKQGNAANIAVLEAVGKLELSTGSKEKAAKTFQRMANLRPDSADDLSQIAQLQIAADDTEGAYNTLRRAVWVEPRHAGALSALIRLEARTRRVDDALRRAEQFRSNWPDSDLGHQLLGEVLVNQKRYDEAIAAFRQALEKSESVENVLRLHLALRAASRNEEALRILRQHADRFGEDPRFARALAAAYIDTQEYDTAIREHERILGRAPNDPAVLNNLAWLYEKTGDPRALATAERAFAISPNAPEVMDTLGWILVQRGDPARGLTLLREAHARSSVNPGIRYHLAVALARLGRKNEALAQLREVMRSDDTSVKAMAQVLLQELDG